MYINDIGVEMRQKEKEFHCYNISKFMEIGATLG